MVRYRTFVPVNRQQKFTKGGKEIVSLAVHSSKQEEMNQG